MTDSQKPTYADDGQCHETAGFLFSHRCDRLSFVRCSRCGKPICDRHSHELGDAIACTACVKADPMAGALPPGTDPGTVPPGTVPPGAIPPGTVRGTRYSSYYDDPYFYSYHYYPGYYSYHEHSSYRDTSHDPSPVAGTTSPDPNDFTAGDSASVRQEGDEAFETSTGES